MATAVNTQQCVIRRATPADALICGQICYDAFATVNRKYNFPPDFPGPEIAVQLLTWMFSHPGFYCVVAELRGKLAGSNCLDERGSIAGIGPITVNPELQDSGVGRQLMVDVLAKSKQSGVAGVRLVQAAFHARSMSLYAKLGFDIREPLAVMQGKPLMKQSEGYRIRPATANDLEACNALCRRVHGHDRGAELNDAVAQGGARVALRNDRAVAYTSNLGFFGHTVAENNEAMQALIAAAEQFSGPGFLLPTRNTELFRWCLGNGLRVVEPMTLMTIGLYNEPAGAFLPSILF